METTEVVDQVNRLFENSLYTVQVFREHLPPEGPPSGDVIVTIPMTGGPNGSKPVTVTLVFDHQFGKLKDAKYSDGVADGA